MAAAAAVAPSVELIIDSPGNPSLRVPLHKQRYKVGRAGTNDLPFPTDHGLSREHLLLERTEVGWTVTDLASRNGTKINGSPLKSTLPLTHGDRITAGHLSMRFDVKSEFADAKLRDVRFIDKPEAEATPNHVITADLNSALQTSMKLGALVRAGRELARHCPLEELFSVILNLTIEAVQASRGAVVTLEPDGDFKARAVAGEILQISTAVRDRVVQQRKSLLVRDTSADLDFADRHSIVAQQIRSFLAVPLQTDERVIGFIYLDSPQLIREFTTDDLNLATVMANIAAIRIEHARLIEAEKQRLLMARELERAAEIQRRLLPASAPQVTDFDLAGYNAPCRTVGGDYFDFIPYPDGSIAILIGDVSGKGMAAALLMSSLQARCHVVFENSGDLGQQVAHLNRLTVPNCPGNCFVTFCAVVLDAKAGKLRYCNAGHNAPLLFHAAGEVESLEATGVVLGILPNITYQEKTCRFEPGDLLLLFSDGVTEACGPDPDDEFGEDRLKTLVCSTQPGQTVAAVLESIKSEIGSFTAGNPPADDVTLVLARRL